MFIRSSRLHLAPPRHRRRSVDVADVNLGEVVGATHPPRTAPRGKNGFRITIFAWILVAPAIVLVGPLIAYPLVRTFVNSFYLSTSKTWGIGNYSFAVGDPAFSSAARNTLVWGIVSMLVVPLIGLIGAALVEDGPIKHKGLLRFCFFFPYLFSLAAAGVVCVQMLDPTFGLVHGVLSLIGLGGVRVTWLDNPSAVLWIAIVLFVWNQSPFCFLVMSASIRQIDRDMYEAAVVDGATGVKRFWYITVPVLRPITSFSSSLC